MASSSQELKPPRKPGRFSAVLGARRRIAVYFALGLLLLVIDPVVAKTGLPVRTIFFVPFFAGALIREAGSKQVSDGRIIAWGLLCVGLILGGSPHSNAVGTVYQPLVELVGRVSSTPLYLIKMLGAVLLVYSVILLRPKFFETRIAVWLGETSFASYLIHGLILSSATSFVFIRVGDQFLALQAMGFVALTYALAVAYRNLVDEPAIRLSRRIKRYPVSTTGHLSAVS